MDIADDKVVVPGGTKIQLGTEWDLIRKLQGEAAKKGPVVKPMSPEYLRRKLPPEKRDDSGIGIAQDRFDYKLERLNDSLNHVEISDQGLTQSYGVFGVPGCGKTYLLKHLISQVVALFPQDDDRKYGGLILDPKASLMGDIISVMKACGREDDLIIINEESLKKDDSSLNILDCFLEPTDLGKALAMAAQSAGISSKEPYWLNELGSILGAGLGLLYSMRNKLKSKPTLSDLVELLLGEVNVGDEGEVKYKSKLEIMIELAGDCKAEMDKVDAEEFEIHRGVLQRYLNSGKDKPILSSFIDQSYGQFRRPRFKVFCKKTPPDGIERNIYDAIIEEGKLVLVSVSKRSLAISKILCTLVKTLFQQTVLTRLDRKQSGELENYTRPLIFLADEYSDVATELPGQSMGDGVFFSMMRQYGCMGLVATQSVHMLQNSSLGEAWKGIYANMAAKIFMQTGDAETAEEASKLVGESEFRFKTFSRTYSKEGATQTINTDLKDKKDLPTKVLLQSLGRGQAVIVGSTDGMSRPGVRFIKVDDRDAKA